VLTLQEQGLISWRQLGEHARKAVGNWKDAVNERGFARPTANWISDICVASGCAPNCFTDGEEDISIVEAAIGKSGNTEWTPSRPCPSAELTTSVSPPPVTPNALALPSPDSPIEPAPSAASDDFSEGQYGVSPLFVTADWLTKFALDRAPWIVFVVTASFAAVFLLLPAVLIGVSSVPAVPANLGFYYTSWPWMTALVIPALLATMSITNRLLYKRISTLLDNRVVEPIQGFFSSLELDLARFESRVRVGALLVAAGITAFDLAAASRPYLDAALVGDHRVAENVDWKNAFQQDLASPFLNALFVLAPFSFQGIAAYLTVGSLLRLAVVLDSVLKLWPSPFARQPLYRLSVPGVFADPERRMGLRPIGGPINLFLMMLGLFAVYPIARYSWHVTLSAPLSIDIGPSAWGHCPCLKSTSLHSRCSSPNRYPLGPPSIHGLAFSSSQLPLCSAWLQHGRYPGRPTKRMRQVPPSWRARSR
jgi:hypothetical protein